jgi:hypothetical protein
MLNSSWNTSYKALVRNAQSRECPVSDQPLSEIIVDVRSRIFRYMRLTYTKRNPHDRARSVFRAMKDIRLSGKIVTEKRMIFNAAMSIVSKELGFMEVPKSTYVFPSEVGCPHKERARATRIAATADRLEEFRTRLGKYKENIFDLKALDHCASALDSYLISDLEGVSMAAPFCPAFTAKVQPGRVVPGDEDCYESDRTCSRLARGVGAAVLTEDFDNLVLFGCDMVVVEAHRGFFVYTSLKDVMAKLDSVSRKDAVHKCCLLGTDYNLGLKGIGPVKINKIDAKKTKELFETCIGAQHIKTDTLYRFFML